MHRRRFRGLILAVICILFIVVSFPMNEWFCETMPRHQLLQLPAMILLGMVSGKLLSEYFIRDASLGIAILIFTMSSLVFWMLPHSIDAAVINPWFNRLMHLDMYMSGFFTVVVLRGIAFEIKVAFLWMVSAMILATGITLKSFDILLCSSYTILQQNETGFYLLLAGFVLLVITMIVFFHGLASRTKDKEILHIY